MGDRKRPVNLTMSDRTRDRLKGLKERMDCDSLSEVIRRSIELLEVVEDRKTQGDQLILRDAEGTEREIIIR